VRADEAAAVREGVPAVDRVEGTTARAEGTEAADINFAGKGPHKKSAETKKEGVDTARFYDASRGEGS